MKVTHRICHLAKYYPPMPGGIETHVQTLARAQASFGAEVSVLCVNGFDEKRRPALRTNTVKQLDNNVQVVSLGRLSSFARFDLCPESIGKLRQIVNESYSIIHLHTPNPIMLIALMMIRPRIPLVVTHHSDIVKQRVLKYVLHPIEHIVYSKAARILTSSPNYAKGSDVLKCYKNQLQVMPFGLELSTYTQPSQKALSYSHSLQVRHGAPIWLTVGRLVYYKALHIAIEALAFVPGTLIIIGTGPLEKELKTLAKQLGLYERIIWHGHASTDELIGAYHAATALWFPSNVRSEGFGLVQVEAMATGCPVINTDIAHSGVSWVSRHEKEGLTVPPNDSLALAQASKRLLHEPELRNRLATASRKRACEFDHMVMAQRSFEIYEQALHYSYLKAQPGILQVE